MISPLRLAISGAAGRMGAQLQQCLRQDTRFELVYAVVAPGSPFEGQTLPGTSVHYTQDWNAAPDIDVVVDFSTPHGLAMSLSHCLAHGIALVSGTTALGSSLEQQLTAAAKHIALLRAANFSLGVAVLTRLLREAATTLPDWDLEIVEAHHARKEDAPSGTALALGATAANARGGTLAKDGVYAREGRPGPRQHGQIGFAVIRGGDIVGEHQAILIGQGERLELSHRANNRAIFAQGALEAAFWLADKEPGNYQPDAMLAQRASGAQGRQI